MAAVVAPDLSVRAVPKHKFQILADPSFEGTGTPIEVSTGFDGLAAVELGPGRYRLQSMTPLQWENAQLEWDVAFEILPGSTTRLELSTDNGRMTSAPESRRVTDEALVFQKARPAVFLVEADAAHGSGFLVDTAGLVLTNHHVVSQARYVAVKVEASKKYPAQVLALDGSHDVAVIRVNPEIVRGIEPLPIARAADGIEPLIAGERVVAIGSPLTQEAVMTTGVVSKIQPDAIISDVNINHGNSGGPLVNLAGEVVGLNTFGVPDSSGPGISGIVRIHLADKVLSDARTKAAEMPPPAADLLPVASETPYPAAALKDMITSDPPVEEYKLEAGKIDLLFITPPLLHSVSKQGELRAADQQKKRRKENQEGAYNPMDNLYGWRRHTGIDYDPIVYIRAEPELKMTGGSKAALFFGALAGVVPPARYRFKTDFREMQLLKDGVEVKPIVPGRSCQAVSMRQGLVILEDIGCVGFYQYPPEAFIPGSSLVLKVANEDTPQDPEVIKLEADLVCRIYKDFVPYHRQVKGADAPIKDCKIEGRSEPTGFDRF